MAGSGIIVSVLTKSLSLRGRAPRSEFLFFLPIGVAIASLFGAIAAWKDFTFLGVILTVFCAATPLLTLWWRRLQDVGDKGVHAITPWIGLLVSITFVVAVLRAGEMADTFSQWGNPALLLLVAPLALIAFLGDTIGQVVGMIIALIGLIIFLFRFSYAFGQALVPSQPGPNKYGPNPHEVTP